MRPWYDVGMANAGRPPREPEPEPRLLWFWIWPAIGSWAIIWHWFDPAAFERCPHVLFFGPLIGTATAGWTVIRTRDRRYAPQLLTSIVLLCIGAAFFWQSF